MITTLTHMRRRLLPALALTAALSAAGVGATAMAADLSTMTDPLPIRLQNSITIAGDVVRLGDLFTGEIRQADKAVSAAPAPGQRTILPADWLAGIAKTNGVDWKPSGPYDRVIVLRAAKTIPAHDILTAIKAELIARGMPRNFGLKLFSPLDPVAIAVNAASGISVREAVFDPASGSFSAVAELAPGDAAAQFIPVRGSAKAVVAIPMLKQGLARNTVITEHMVDMVEIAEADVGADTVTNPDDLIGKAPRGYLKSGQAIRASEVHEYNLTNIPVLRADMRRGEEIVAGDVIWASINSSNLPDGVITDLDKLEGKGLKRSMPAGSPLRQGDIQTLVMVEVPVASRDIRRGIVIGAEDINWVRMSESNIAGEVLHLEQDLVGRIANANIRAGQTFRPISVMRPVAVLKGKLVNVIYNTRAMNLTAKGKVLEDGAVGQVIRVSNTKSNTHVLAEVLNAETVRVTEQQTAMN